MKRGPPSLGVLLRRRRTERGLSQAALADAAGISQATVSYYENDRIEPSAEHLQQLARVLDLPASDLQQARSEEAEQASVEESEPRRAAFLRTLDTIAWRFAILDRPAGVEGGDLAFGVDLHSHVLLVALDAQGAGSAASSMAKVTAACAFGATILPGGGVPSPEDVVESTLRFSRLLGAPDDSAAVCAMSFERRTRRARQCRLGMPPPWLGASRWTGKPDGPGGAFVGEREIDPGGLVLVATDGIAHLPTKGNRTLWDAPELRMLLGRVNEPEAVIKALAMRAGGPHERRADDGLAIAVMPWRR